VRDVIDRGSNRPTTPMDLLRVAMERGIDPDKLKVFVDMAERFQAEARKAAYYDALARARSSPPEILKNRQVKIPLKTGGTKQYHHASHDEVAMKVADWMAPFGLACMWIPNQSKGTVTITCRITHALGHHEDFTLSAPEDESGSKSPIQAIASTKTYLERYTLLGGLGLSSKELGERDDDGAGPAMVPERETPKPAKPEAYEVWKQHVTDNAKCGTDALRRAWKTAPQECRDYCKADDAEWAWWLAQKALAEKVPLQSDESIP
jgi:hypothetical protein